MVDNINVRQYPCFIKNTPCGNDRFEGKSQERLAKAIAKHFEKTDSCNDEKNGLPRIVGLEGIWGSGKSNVIRLLEKELKDKYYFFEYDAWGHQEDLQRRSFLELLTSNLISDKVLYGNTKINIKGGGSKTVSWKEKLKYLLARKTETVTEKYPRISNGMATAALVAILTPIFTFIAFAIKTQITGWVFTIISILISALPVIVALWIWIRAYKKDNKKYNLSYLLAIYDDKIENDICYETLSEDEPTVTEFKAWMQDISDFIGDNRAKKLVVIFDNMDRLPAEKVKELWSSIHTFFSEDGFSNIWAIIPFDEKHLACAFGSENEIKAKQLTSYFINKTFPIVYRVAPPVITDFRKIFNTFFIEAFGNTLDENEKETINSIFRLLRPNANVREIISFINELVALKSVWGNEITLLNISIFILKKEKLLEQPITQILSGDYLSEISKTIKNDLNLQRQMSALVYGIEVDHARQIPLTKYIENCIKSEVGYNINEYSDSNKQFDPVLEDVIKNLDDELLDNAINCLFTLTRENNEINKIWNYLAERKIEQNISKQEIEEVYKKLLIKSDKNHKRKIVKDLCVKNRDFPDFKGSNYFKALNTLEAFIQENNLECLLDIQEISLSPELFVDYMLIAKSDYMKYKVITDADKLDEYLCELLPDNLNCTEILPILKKSDKYAFGKFYNKIEKLITSNEITENNFGEINFSYKTLSVEKPLSNQLDTSKVLSILSVYSSQINGNIYPQGYSDLVAMAISKNNSVSNYDDNLIAQIASCMNYYANYGELLKNSISWNNPLLNKVLQFMCLNKLGHKLSIEEIIPIFDQVRTKIDVSGHELFTDLSRWSEFAKTKINKDNIKTIISSATFWEYSTSINNELAQYLNDIIINSLSDIDESTLYNTRKQHTSDYWFVTIAHLISSEYLKILPDNLNEFGKHILKDIANGTQSLPLPALFQNIINKLDRRTTKATIKDIKNLFCNGATTINKAKFLFFEDWFKQQGDMDTERSGSVADKIIKPVIGDNECMSHITADINYYSQIINNGGDESNDLRKVVETMTINIDSSELINFAKKIGVEKKEKK